MQVEYREALYRKQSYLCFKYLVKETENYVGAMTKFNWALRSAYAAKLTGSEEAVAIFEGLVKVRNLRHISYMKILLKNTYCSYPESSDFVKNLPYETKNNFVLDTKVDETTKVRAHQWKNLVLIIPKKIRVSHIFGLTAEFSMDGEFLPHLGYKSKEVGKVDLLSLNRLSGFRSSLF